MTDFIEQDHQEDGIDRRGFLKCMAWAGTGLLCVISGGVLSSRLLGQPGAAADAGELSFVQISDSHIGFSKAANKDVTATLQEAVAKINALRVPPDFILHTGDLTQLSKADQFDTVDQILKSAKTKTGQVFWTPGEHDVLNDGGQQYLVRYGKATQGGGWQSFDRQGVHFIGLVNVLELKPGGLGSLGAEQIAWMGRDVAGLASSTPIVVFAHVPLWSVYPDWGWGTADSAQALALLKRFGSVTVLNGHIHQTLQKVEGNVTFHTAASTAFPQPAPGAAPSPGPMVVPSDNLRGLLGITSVHTLGGRSALAIVDTPLASLSVSGTQRVLIDNFSFVPATLTVLAGSEVTWVNHDDVPHTVLGVDKQFKSPALDTGETFSHRFAKPGTYDYFCSIHPMMTAKIVVQ